MNKEKFYEVACEKLVKEILKARVNKETLYNFLLNALSYLKDKDCDDIENEVFTSILMPLTTALSICDDLCIDETEVFLKNNKLILFEGRPCDLLNDINYVVRENIECSLYNGGHSIMIHYIDKRIFGDSK